jgi:hypothetical protein
MNDEQDINVNEIKQEERMKIEIPVEEEGTTGAKSESEIVEEFKRLGHQFADTLESMWNSDERRRMETEIRAGVRTFADEVDRVLRDARQSPAATRVKEEAVGMKERVETGELSDRARTGVVQGLRWLSHELERLAEQFTPAKAASVEKAPEDETTGTGQ